MESHVFDDTKPTTTLPIEIISEILIPFRPRFTTSDRRYIDIFARWQSAYFLALHQLAQWRHVCRTWYHAITPILYSNIIIHFTPTHQVSRRLQFAQHHPHLVRALIIRAGGVQEELSDVRIHLLEAIRKCDGLVRLEFYDLPSLFAGTNSGDIERYLYGIAPPTLTTLVFRSSLPVILDEETGSPRTIQVMTSILRGLGPMIERIPDLQLLVLSPIDWNWTYEGHLSLPTRLLSLERLTLYGFDVEFMSNFLSRVSNPGNIIPSGSILESQVSQVSVPLRDLTISRISNSHIDISSIYSLFEINNIGRYLTSLRIQKLHIHNILAQPETPITILGLCPSLERFFFIAHSRTSWIDVVPPDCRGYVSDLGIVPHLSYRASTERFTQVIRQLREVWGPELKRLHLNLEADYAAGPLTNKEWVEVEQACREVGLELVEDTYAIP
ncbi:hypothetical protein BDN72DRAFT_846746 [Pluteus cervinus]|uniref:Uncharacterized protein n=1 Tax=Pluteus cervinus TaxID=181527 RepID=A0ACD3AF16_9AGAR|nr:hypothetical protein BDN72DRAFT_846746 [Pluteus cervinus]